MNSIAFFEIANEDIYNSICKTVKIINRISKGVDFSVFCQGYSKYKYSFGSFCVPEMHSYSGTILAYSIEDLLDIINSNKYADTVFYYVGQNFNLIALMKCLAAESIKVICENKELSAKMQRLTGSNFQTTEEYFAGVLT